MAPYAHFNDTSRSLYVPSHTFFSPYPLYKADASYSPSLTFMSPLPTSPGSFPHLGIGPAILQPSSARTSKAIPLVSSPNSSSPRLGYIGLAGIFVALLLLVSFFFQRCTFGCPKRRRAEHSHGRHVLRSQAARAREMEENTTPRMHQLPRDRIRAMNTVPKTTPSLSERQDILEGIPCLQNSSFPLLSTSNPSSPGVTNNRLSTGFSVPPTPTMPTSPVPTIDQLEPSVLSKIVRKLPEFRYTWDFRCKGLYNFALGAVLDISRANSVPDSRNSPPDSGDAEVQSVDPNPRACENAVDNASIPILLTPEASPDVHDKETHDKNSELVKSGVLGSDIDHNLTMHPLLTLSPVSGIKVSGSDFSNPLSGSALSSCLSDISLISFRDESTLNTTNSTLFPDVSYKSRLHQQTISRNGDGSLSLSTTTIFKTDIKVSKDSERDLLRAAGVLVAGMDAAAFPISESPVSSETVCSDKYASVCAKPARNQLVLSKPNHRMLTPTSSSLKIRPSPSTASDVTGDTYVSSSYLSGLPLPIFTSSLHTGLPSNTRMGRNRAASEANLAVLGRSKLVDSLVCVSFKPEVLSALGKTSDKHCEKESNSTGSVFENNTDALCSSISMPLCVELACLSSILKRRYKAKLE